MANQKAQLIGTIISGPKSGKPATQTVTVIDTDANLAQFVQRNNATTISFPGDVEFTDFVMVANTATITRVVPVVDGNVVNERSMLTAFAADPKSARESRLPNGSWVLPMGSELSLISYTA